MDLGTIHLRSLPRNQESVERYDILTSRNFPILSNESLIWIAWCLRLLCCADMMATQVGYAYNFIYNTTFPLSRIALVLLYKQIFYVKQWFIYGCWALISCYAGYIISWVVTVAVGILPVAAYWDTSIKPTHAIDGRKLQLANCSFNIATDVILLAMPLMVIWTLQMSKMRKLGVSALFCLGVLTVIASIMRCYYTLHASNYDPLCT